MNLIKGTKNVQKLMVQIRKINVEDKTAHLGLKKLFSINLWKNSDISLRVRKLNLLQTN